jgi:hypothetical protein
MTSSRRRLGLQSRLLDNGSSSSSRLVRVRRILLFGQRARRRSVVGVGRVLSTRLHKLDFLKSRQRMSKQCSYMQNSVIQQGLRRPLFPYFHFVISVLSMRECKRLLATLDLGVGTYSGVFFLLVNYLFFLP